jgi:hypothetical protein
MTTATETPIIINTPSDAVKLLELMQQAAKRWIAVHAPFETLDHMDTFCRLINSLQDAQSNFTRNLTNDVEF